MRSEWEDAGYIETRGRAASAAPDRMSDSLQTGSANGAGADIDAAESIAGMRRALAGLDGARNGSFLNYDGTPLAW